MTKKTWKIGTGFLILCLLSLGIGTHADISVQGRIEEKAFDVVWDYTFGGSNWDWPSTAIQSSDGGFLMAGGTNSFGTANETHSDAWVIKTDANGQQEWNRTFGKASSWVDKISQTTDGGYYLTGGSGDGDHWVMKLDSSGQQEWNSSFEIEISPFEVVYIHTTLHTVDGGFLVTLNANNGDDDVGSRFLMKFNAMGVQEWNVTLGVDIPMYPNEMISTLDGGVLVVGGIGEHPGINLLLLKLDATGSQQWNTSFGGHEDDSALSVIQTTNGDYVISGLTTSYAYSSTDFWLIKTDSSGHLLWNTTFGGLFNQEAHRIIQTTDGGYLLAGITWDISDNSDIWLVKTNATGAHVWNTTFGGSANEWVAAVFQVAETDFVLAGTTESFGAGRGDFWLFKFSVSDKTASDGPGFDFSVVLFCFVLILLVSRKRRS